MRELNSHLTLTIGKELKEELYRLAYSKDMSVSSFLRKLIREELEKNGVSGSK